MNFRSSCRTNRNTALKLAVSLASMSICLTGSPALLAQIAGAQEQRKAPENDFAKQEVASRVVSRFFPAERQTELMNQMVGPLFDTILAASLEDKELADSLEQHPRLANVLADFIAEEKAIALDLTAEHLPLILDATAQAYARTMTMAELEALDDYLQTPSGLAYIDVSNNIFADPSIQQAQQAMIVKSQAGVEKRLVDFRERLADAMEEEIEAMEGAGNDI